MATAIRSRRPRPVPIQRARSARKGVAGRPKRSRRPSASVRTALEVFDTLPGYFAHTSALAKALRWDEATAAEWRAHTVVRPHKAKVRQVILLAQLCAEASAYLADHVDVGAWVNAPLPNLRGNSPADWLRENGVIGLRELTAGMLDWMPRIPDGEIEAIDEDAAVTRMIAASKTDKGVYEFRRMLADLPPARPA